MCESDGCGSNRSGSGYVKVIDQGGDQYAFAHSSLGTEIVSVREHLVLRVEDSEIYVLVGVYDDRALPGLYQRAATAANPPRTSSFGLIP